MSEKIYSHYNDTGKLFYKIFNIKK